MPDPVHSVAAIQAVEAVPNILSVVCRATGMGFAAVARVTPDRWVACAVKDLIDFGLKPGGELQIETTLHHGIGQATERLVINHAAQDRLYRNHPAPALHGFQSYISVPIVLSGGRFFGVLCAIDPQPRVLDKPATLQMFDLFAQVIAAQLDTLEKLQPSQQAPTALQRTVLLREQFIDLIGLDLRASLRREAPEDDSG